MLLGFKDKFKDKVLAGTKIHTIRKTKQLWIQPGEKLIMATGIRTKNYQRFCDTHTLKSIQRIKIDTNLNRNNPMVYISVDGCYLCDNERHELATKDGFESLDAFLDFFRKLYKTDLVPFEGFIFHWTDKRY